ncbi:16S rRNA (cytidine(1402)-2'-O)-methyltransferase [Corynebacterium glutamicum]|uniref:16S rRNA (cytidine(1402)-2'-O)-methyltransferase n=1 Tax=Corynebacterium glutamicum TaxID=1718 RepID=UPI0004F6BC76|nr:16S rRNA (cytidine(1402)-2'-O)-methyltransferase [Corynebacterium glutamicum]AIK84605.1 16S rRNA methyltransferase [Corynebacterium glutamicum]AIK87390.1 16S rRNA methyltransferase [Corynebacterium glutamicum]OKX89321.1 16S rRNA (cytidine(1402)-2'-O)-methyltransferase [Corynebacterium glutamicum]QDX75112.1 16S rRNA methyltransferase [Corynebacterium glutamicum]QDX77875.1 16S rRNA methyltransferase [Corynebacterium glutamicum]
MHVAELSLPTGIIIAATPLGNIGDASPRLVHALANATVVAAEDTRRTASLAAALGVEIKGQLVSNFDHNEQARVGKLIEAARAGTVLVVSDAGMPVVSDPGFALIDAAHDANIPVTCFPGPSAVPTALALSGLHVGRFAFDGFAPRKQGARTTWLESLKTEKRAVCFFESPHRIAETLAHAAEVLGERRAAVCRELSKTYEQVKRGTLPELAEWAQDGVRGEITVVIEGAGDIAADVDSLIDAAQQRVDSGERLKAVCADLAKIHGVSKNELYDAVISAREN